MDLDDHLLDRFSRLPTSGPFTHAVVPASYSMISHAPLLQRLHDLDKTSPQFHQRLSDFLRGDDYRSLLSGLQNEDLVSLVEYLAGVSLQMILLRAAPNVGVGSRQYFRS